MFATRTSDVSNPAHGSSITIRRNVVHHLYSTYQSTYQTPSLGTYPHLSTSRLNFGNLLSRLMSRLRTDFPIMPPAWNVDHNVRWDVALGLEQTLGCTITS